MSSAARSAPRRSCARCPKPAAARRPISSGPTTSGRLQAHRDDFLHSDYLRVTKSDNANDETELWRVSLRVGATKGSITARSSANCRKRSSR